ncbi:MAG: phosphate ABC transporter permease PstA [Planctomycetes bacterium]|nr:phosphate ABC transporter permease PstA [Planctomycetota bacterium]
MTTAGNPAFFQPRLNRRRWMGRLFAWMCLAAAIAAVLVLAALLWHVGRQGASLLSVKFLTSGESTLDPLTSGIRSPLWGTIWLMGLTTILAVPIGVAAAIYLEEYAPDNRLTRFIQLNIANLAGVPSVVYGLLGLTVFVRGFALRRSVAAGAAALALLVLPVVIIASREALLGVPKSIREAAYAVGATRWQTIRHHVLPAAVPGILTGVILALSRAIGEAAPLIVVGAVAYMRKVPAGPLDPFTALPIKIFNWSEMPAPEFARLAGAAIIVLLILLLSMNGVAVGIRAWQQRRKSW